MHSGFYEAYKLLQDDLRETLAPILDEHPFSTILVTGHSLGSALAVLGALDIKIYFGIHSKLIRLYTFGQPRVGDKNFSDWVNKEFNFNNYYRVVNYDDMVPHLPPQAGS